MKTETQKDKKNKLTIAIVLIIIAFVGYINILSFDKDIASNNKLLINFKQNVDELHNFRTPKIAVLLYNNSKVEFAFASNKSYFSFLNKTYGNAENEVVLNPVENSKQIADVAKTKKLSIKTVELNSQNLDNYSYVYDKDNHEENIKNFVNEYINELSTIIAKSIENNHTHVSKKDFPLALFDKGNSFIYDNKGVEVGSLNANIGIGQDIANNIEEAKKMGLNIDNFEVAIITEAKEIKYKTQKELYAKIIKNVDGVILRDGQRQAVFLPKEWSLYKTKKDFINALKLKANLLPNYTSNSIKFYVFREVKI